MTVRWLDIPGLLLGDNCEQTHPHSNELTHNNRGTVRNGVFSLVCAEGYKEDNWGNQVSSVRESEARIVQLEGSYHSEKT
jgi:hypothetical protein